MRFLLVFLLSFIPLAAALWLLVEGQPRPARLPDGEPPADGPGIVTGSDLADEHGIAPFKGKLHVLDDVRLRIIDEQKNYVRTYLQLGRLARHEGQPRLEQVSGAVFGEPEEGRPNLKATIEAPYVEGNAASLLHRRKDLPRFARLGGEVFVRDAQGRVLARMQGARIDLESGRLRSDEAVVLRQPDDGIEIRAAGLDSDLDLADAALPGPVVITTPKARLGCSGTARLFRDAERHESTLVLDGEAWVEHPLLRAKCDRIAVRFGEKERVLKHALLEGGVAVTLDASLVEGLEEVRVPRAEIFGEKRIVLGGPLVAVLRRPLDALGLGERTLDVRAGGAEVLVRRAAEDRLEPVEVRFHDGFEARDRDGAGHLVARMVRYVAAEKLLVVQGPLDAKTPDGSVMTGRLRFESPEKDRFELRLDEVERITLVAAGKLGPLGDEVRGDLTLRCEGPLRISQNGKKTVVGAQDAVRADLARSSHLSCERLSVVLQDREIESVTAAGALLLLDRSRGAELRGMHLRYRDREAVLEGAPALFQSEGRGAVSAHKLAYRDDGRFAASGEVQVEALLGEGRWRIRCGSAKGVLREDRSPESLEIDDGLVADGPEGQHIEGASFRYEAETGKALLLGNPARVRRGDGLAISAEGFDLVVRNKDLVSGRTRGAALLELRPRPTGRIRRWKVALRGPASVAGEEVAVPGGADLEAFDENDRLLVSGSANRATVKLRRTEQGWEPVDLAGEGGVTVRSHGKEQATVTAERLSYVAGERRVDMRGGARVRAKGWSPQLTFEHVVFVLGPDGVDLKQASEVVVERPR